MKFHKLRAGEVAGSYLVDSPVTETDILRMAQQLATHRLSKGRALTDPHKVREHLQVLLQDLPHEVFAVLLLDSKHRVIRFEELFRGTLDAASVYPREVIKTVLAQNAAAVILVHNHPSGDPSPSATDIRMTKEIIAIAEPMGISVHDHIIIGRHGHASMRGQKLI